MKAESIDNDKQWKYLIDNDIYNCNYRFENQFEYKELFLYKNPIIPYCQIKGGGHTWSKYNKLVHLILKDKAIVNEHEQLNGIKRDLKNTSFLLNTFITELNILPSELSKGIPNSSNRRQYLRHNFFQNFEIIILGFGSYLNSNEISNLFNVEPLNLGLEKIKRQKMDFYTNKERNKIIVNTNQLSMAISNEYLQKIADLLRTNSSI